MTADELAAAPEGTKSKDMTGMPGMKFAMTISTLDCTGCGSCAQVCPGMKGEKALVMKPIDTQRPEPGRSSITAVLCTRSPKLPPSLRKPPSRAASSSSRLLEFSGACAGCGETPYAKLATQLFGDRMFIANATGCSSIWGGSAPATPYTVNKKGHGPAWAELSV